MGVIPEDLLVYISRDEETNRLLTDPVFQAELRKVRQENQYKKNAIFEGWLSLQEARMLSRHPEMRNTGFEPRNYHPESLAYLADMDIELCKRRLCAGSVCATRFARLNPLKSLISFLNRILRPKYHSKVDQRGSLTQL